MKNRLVKLFTKIGYKIRKKCGTAITDNSKGQYAIVVEALNHKNAYILGDILTSEIFIHIPDSDNGDKNTRELFIVLTKTKVIISNHDFPNLGDIDEVVAERLYEKAKLKLSNIRQQYKNEQMKNVGNLIDEVRKNLRESSKQADSDFNKE